jgi:hypothetical protein
MPSRRARGRQWRARGPYHSLVGESPPKYELKQQEVEGLGRSSASLVPSKPQNSHTPVPGMPSKGIHPTWGELQRQKKVGSRGPKVRHPLCVGPSPDGPFLAVTSEGATVKECIRRWPGLDFCSHGTGSSCLVIY